MEGGGNVALARLERVVGGVECRVGGVEGSVARGEGKVGGAERGRWRV